MRRFCSVCGRVTKELFENKCRGCLFLERVAVKLPERIELNICRQCMKYRDGVRWIGIGGSLEDAVSSAVKRSIEIKNLEKPSISLVSGEMDAKYDIPVSVKVSGEFLGSEISSEKKTNVHVSFGACKDCSRRRGKYYESILQVRGEMSDEERETIAECVRNVVSPTSFISDFKELKAGMDFYIGSTSAAKKAASAVLEKFGGELLISPKLVGRDNRGRATYRTNLALRLPRFKECDIIEFNGKVMQVIGLTKDKVAAFDLEDRKRVTIPIRSLESAIALGRKKDIVKATVSEVVRGRVQVIDMKTYETLYFRVKIPVKVKDEVEIFRSKKDYLLKTERE